MKRLNEVGDTIVEVMIALAVTSLLIGGAFATANRSLAGARQSQERGEALKYVESQLEVLRTLSATVGYDAGSSPTLFCISIVPPATTIVTGFSGSLPTTANNDNFSVYPAACSVGTDGRYKMSISRSSGDSHDFVARARWTRLSSTSNDEVLIRYRVY